MNRRLREWMTCTGEVDACGYVLDAIGAAKTISIGRSRWRRIVATSMLTPHTKFSTTVVVHGSSASMSGATRRVVEFTIQHSLSISRDDQSSPAMSTEDSPTSRASRLRRRLVALKRTAHDVASSSTAHPALNVVIDATATRACAIAADARARAVLERAESELATLRIANQRNAQTLARDARAFATSTCAFNATRGGVDAVWNFPSGRVEPRTAVTWTKMRVLRAVEVGARRARVRAEQARAAMTRDDGADENVDEDGAREDAMDVNDVDEEDSSYTCAEVVYPRRAMTQCGAFRAMAISARDAFNASFLAAVERRREIVERLRSIDRRVTIARKMLNELGETAVEPDVLAEWWDGDAMRWAMRCGDDTGFRLETVVRREGDLKDEFDDNMVLHSDRDVSANENSSSRAVSKLRTMMGEDIADDAGIIDFEACDKRQGHEVALTAASIVDRPDFLDDIFHEANTDNNSDDMHQNKLSATNRKALTAEQTVRLTEYENALEAVRAARDERRNALRGEIRRLLQEATDITTMFDERVRVLAHERRDTAFQMLMLDLRRGRIARRLHERFIAGDFDGRVEEEAHQVRLVVERAHRSSEAVRDYTDSIERSKSDLDAAVLAVKSALKAFRRDVQDNPASCVHLDALVTLYQHPDAIARVEDNVPGDRRRVGVFPQGLDDRWWDKLTAARSRRFALERELASMREAHAKTSARMRELEADARDAQNRADAQTVALHASRCARRNRAYDVDVRLDCSRGFIEIPLVSVADAVEHDDVIVIPRSRIDDLNERLRAAHAAKIRGEDSRAATRDDIEHVKWEIQALDLRCEDISARCTEVALLRVSKRLQRFLAARETTKSDEDESSGRTTIAATLCEDVSEVAALAGRVDRNARLHTERTQRYRRDLENLARKERRLRSYLTRTEREIGGTEIAMKV